MRIEWDKDRNAPRCRVINLDTGQQILFCTMADEETGEWHAVEAEVIGGVPRIKTSKPGFVRPTCGHNRLRIEPLAPGEPYLLPSEG